MNTINKNALRPVTKFDQTCAQLTRIAYQLGPDARMPTFTTLCTQARVSKATLDAVLGHLEASGIVMRRQGSGIFVSPQLRRSIALICDPKFSLEPNLRSFWELIVREAQRRVVGTHYDLAFHFSTIQTDSETSGPSLHTALVDDICTGRVQGVLTVGLPAQTLEWINRQGTAVVAFAGEGPVSVNLDGADVVKMGVQTLAARGCRRLALWYPPPTDASEENGNEAEWFRAVLATHGLVFNKHWLRPQEHEPIGNLTFDQVREWVSITFGPAPKTWPDGLLITNDILTRDVMPVLHKRNLLPNHDIVIVSHANSDSPVLRAYEEELTLLEYDSGEIVQTMFDLMETLMRNEAISQRRIIIKPKVRFPRLSSNLQAMHQVTNANKPSR